MKSDYSNVKKLTAEEALLRTYGSEEAIQKRASAMGITRDQLLGSMDTTQINTYENADINKINEDITNTGKSLANVENSGAYINDYQTSIGNGASQADTELYNSITGKLGNDTLEQINDTAFHEGDMGQKVYDYSPELLSSIRNKMNSQESDNVVEGSGTMDTYDAYNPYSGATTVSADHVGSTMSAEDKNLQAGISMSDEDENMLQTLGNVWEQARDANDQEGMDEAHRMAELLRGKYDFSGGGNGSGLEEEVASAFDSNTYTDSNGNEISRDDYEAIKNASSDWEINDFLFNITGDSYYADKKALAESTASTLSSRNNVNINQETEELMTPLERLDRFAGLIGTGADPQTNLTETGGYSENGIAYNENGEAIGTVGSDGAISWDVTTTDGLLSGIVDTMNNSASDQEFYETAMNELLEGYGETDVKVLTYEEALEQAEAQITPLFEKNRAEYIEELDRDALRRGMMNQLPYESYKRGQVDELELARASEVASLATTIQGQSKADAVTDAQLKTQELQTKLSVLLAGLESSNMSSQNIITNLTTVLGIQNDVEDRANAEAQTEFENNLAVASITGYWENEGEKEPTMALTSLLHSINIDNITAERLATATDASISQAWANISQNGTKLAQASRQLQLQAEGQELDEMMFHHGVQSQAWEMTINEIAIMTPEFDQDMFDSYLDYDESINGEYSYSGVNNSDLAGEYIQSIMESSNAFESLDLDFESMYLENIQTINSQLMGNIDTE